MDVVKALLLATNEIGQLKAFTFARNETKPDIVKMLRRCLPVELCDISGILRLSHFS